MPDPPGRDPRLVILAVAGLLINRTLVYAALSVALTALYFASVLLFQSLFRALTEQESDLAIVASTESFG